MSDNITNTDNIINITSVKIRMQELKNHLETKIQELNGDWIKKNSGYEKDACNQLGVICQTKRYWDCSYNNSKIEIKKGKSIWLDEIRYSEIFMSDTLTDNDECKEETITIFLIPDKNKNKIANIIIIDTKKIIMFLKISAESAKFMLLRHKITTRSINYQQSMTINDLKKIADHII
tara:strand:- start:71 stop:601 length:531 start_codon:yes stop_codon:yes gene_type:complete